MAQVEPMDIDAIDSDFDNKENTYHHSNVLSRTPCTEKGYEELDVSELNMKLRYSLTPASSPMSKSLSGSLDNRNCNHGEDYLNAAATDNGNLTRSLNSTFNKTESVKPKVLPLQTLSTDPFVDTNRNSSTHRPIEPNGKNITISINTNDVDDDLSLPSTSSSIAQTPEATTPTKEIPKPEGSPILRGIRNVLSMFRPSQSPIPPADDNLPKQDNILSPIDTQLGHNNKSNVESVRASTPVDVGKQKETNSSKRSSPLKESVVFNDDLERELQWKDETTILFKQEKIPVHKLFFQNPLTPEESKKVATKPLNTTVEYMDISHNESLIADKTTADSEPFNHLHKNEGIVAVDSDNEFLDCEATFTKDDAGILDTELENKFISSNVIVKKLEVPDVKDDINTTQVIKPDTVDIVSLENASASGNSYHIEIGQKSSELIEITKQFLKSESCSNINEGLHKDSPGFPNQNIYLQNEEQKPTHLQKNVTKDDSHITTIEENVTENKDISDSKIVTYSTTVVINNLEDTSNVCLDQLNKSEYLGETVVATVHNIESVPPSNVSKCSLDTDFMPLLPNIQEQGTPNTENTQVVHVDINKDSVLVADSQIIEDKNRNEEESSIINKNIRTDETVTNFKVEENFVMECCNGTTTKEYAPLNVTDMIESNLTVMQSDLNLLQNDVTKDIEAKPVQAHINDEKETVLKINVCNDINISQDNIIKTPNEACNTVISNFISLNKDCGTSELAIENKAIGRLPLDIPLPEDDDDIEKSINEANNFTEEVVVNQNITFEMQSDKLEIHNMNNNEPSAEFKEVCIGFVEESIKTSPLQVITKHNERTDINSVEKSEAEDCNIEFGYDTNDDGENEIVVLEVNKNKTYNEIQNLDKEIQNEDFTIKQEVTSIHAEDLEKQGTQTVCETTEIHTENKKCVTPLEPDTDVVPSILQAEIIKHSVESPKLENHMSNLKECSIEKFEDLVNTDKDNGETETDEEIITSANNSPYVSVTELPIHIESESQNHVKESDKPLSTQSKICEYPPLSPKIVSKGYNFNFDEIDDPFATKTKIRMSPTPVSPNESNKLDEDLKKPENVSKKTINNRRKSQPDRKRLPQKKTMNTTVIGHSASNSNASKKINQKHNISPLKDHIVSLEKQQNSSDLKLTSKDIEIIETKDREVISQTENQNPESVEFATLSQNLDDITTKRKEILPTEETGEIECIEQTLVISDSKSTSSSEQYFSLGTSSGESVGLMNQTKNVFNIPEIDDVNFNPFATKSKMRMSPPPSEIKTIVFENIINAEAKSSDALQLKANKEFDLGDHTLDKTVIKDCSPNVSNITSSSRDANDKDITVREILTEDEDTIEGPFLETDDLKDVEKLNEMEVANDMMNFDEVPVQAIDENLENGELFIDADAFEFLLNQNKSTTVLDSGKESLFLKFDPLFAKRVSSDGVLAALSKVQKRQSTPKKPVVNIQQMPKENTNANIPVAAPSSERENYEPLEEYSEDLSSSAMSKPMMVVNPAVSSIASPRRSIATPKLNRRSLTFTSPAMAVIDRLLSLSGNTSHLNDDTSSFNASREHNETDFAITQLREMLAEKEIHVHNLRCESKELKERLATLEVQVKSLETESTERLKKINDLNERLSEKTKINKSMATVVEEYERTIASLIAESEQDKKRHAEERLRLINERDEQTAHLTSMELSFSDLHSKYEKSKQIILTCKANEDTYLKSIKEFEDNFSKMQTNYELLKQHATSKLNHANQELEKMNRAHEAEVLKLSALIKRKELDITSLEESLAQKTKANEELTAICDELINKVGN